MDQITARALRNVEWKQVYSYESDRPGGVSFTVYASDALPGLTITKERRGNRRIKIHTVYKFEGRSTDSPTQVVRYWNEKAREAKSGRRPVAGSAKSARSTRGDAGI